MINLVLMYASSSKTAIALVAASMPPTISLSPSQSRPELPHCGSAHDIVVTKEIDGWVEGTVLIASSAPALADRVRESLDQSEREACCLD